MKNNTAIRWNVTGANYNNNWKSVSEKKLSEYELGLIQEKLKSTKTKNLLDLGCGTGRILRRLLENSTINTQIYALDYAQSMVDFCSKEFMIGPNQKIKRIQKCDISKENIPFNVEFDFITSIRVLKYNKNWREILTKVAKSTNPGGIFVFTMPNKISPSYFSDYGGKIWLATIKEVKEALQKSGFILEDCIGFSRLPRFFYTVLPNSNIYASFIMFVEKLLGIILGKTLLAKIIFFTARKPTK